MEAAQFLSGLVFYKKNTVESFVLFGLAILVTHTFVWVIINIL